MRLFTHAYGKALLLVAGLMLGALVLSTYYSESFRSWVGTATAHVRDTCTNGTAGNVALGCDSTTEEDNIFFVSCGGIY